MDFYVIWDSRHFPNLALSCLRFLCSARDGLALHKDPKHKHAVIPYISENILKEKT
jgi:hypothetical protein